MSRYEQAVPSLRPLAAGPGWRVTEVICRAGPDDRPYEERHDWVSIAAVLDGSFTYRSARGRALMAPGSFLLGSAGQCFECGHDHGSGDRCVAFQFEPTMFEDIVRGMSGVRSIAFRGARLPPFGPLLPVFTRVATLTEGCDTLHAEELALDVAAAAVRLDQETTETPLSGRDEVRVTQALELIRGNYHEALTISGLAAACGLGRRRFAAVFRQAVGVTPYQYILNLRLNAAAESLRAGGGTVLQVGLDAGFGDLSEFTRRFHAVFGAPPGRFRVECAQTIAADAVSEDPRKVRSSPPP